MSYPCDHEYPPCRDQVDHQARVEYREHLLGIQFEGASEHAIEVRKRDRKLAVDGAAYRRLRKDGIQPKGVDNSAMLEKAMDHPIEAKLGRSLLSDERDTLKRHLPQVKK